MRCAYLVALRTIEVRDVELPPPPAGGLLVRVRAALTDGTDLKAYRRGHPRMPMPTPFGHEFSGDVVAVGEGVTQFAAGEPIMSVHTGPCGSCFWCDRGEEELCARLMQTMILGAYAEYIVLPPHVTRVNVYRKPPDLPYIAAAFLEPLSCVVHSVERLASRAGDEVVIVGDGGFGFLHALLLQHLGARVYLAGRRDERAALAERLNIAYVDTRSQDVASHAKALNEGRGADAVIESTGRHDVWELVPSLVRRGGTALLFGGLPTDSRVSFDAARLHYDEVRLVSPFHFRPSSVRQAYDLLASRKIDPLPLVSDIAPLEHLPHVFERLDAGEGMKYAVEP